MVIVTWSTGYHSLSFRQRLLCSSLLRLDPSDSSSMTHPLGVSNHVHIPPLPSTPRSHHHRHTSTLPAYPCLSPPHPLPRSSAAFPFTSPRKKPLNPFIAAHCQPQLDSRSERRKENYVKKRTTSLFELIDAAAVSRPDGTDKAVGRHQRVQSVVYNSDRFIPNRREQQPLHVNTTTGAGCAGLAESPAGSPSSSPPRVLTPSQQRHNEHVAAAILSPAARTLTFHASPTRGSPTSAASSPIAASHQRAMSQQLLHTSNLRSHYHSNLSSPTASPLSFTPTLDRILDAPGIVDDYYLNLLHWSSQGEVCIALGAAVYVYSVDEGRVDSVADMDDGRGRVTAVRWEDGGRLLAVGEQEGGVQLWDVERRKRVRHWQRHDDRVSSLSWQPATASPSAVLSSGGRDGCIVHMDPRVKEVVGRWEYAHAEEICGLAWSPDGSVLASGGNDNLCHLWSASHLASPSCPTSANTSSSFTCAALRHTYHEHTAAVKALAWSPHHANVLATGGGTTDRHVRLLSTHPTCPAVLAAVDTRSQVCSMLWSTQHEQLLTSHGYTDNQLCLWDVKGRAGSSGGLVKRCELSGHQARVLHTALSPDGTMVCSAGADETLRFWKVWESVGRRDERRESALRSPLAAVMR